MSLKVFATRLLAFNLYDTEANAAVTRPEDFATVAFTS